MNHTDMSLEQPQAATALDDQGDAEPLRPCGIPRSVVKWTEYDGGNVSVDGRQRPGGDFDAAVSVWVGDGNQLDATQVRKLAAALLDAADKLDGLR
jgi:hypothetical protein